MGCSVTTIAEAPQDAPYLRPGRIGGLALRNRLVRASTSETMAAEDGTVTDALVRFYGALADGGAGLLLTGHIHVRADGQCTPRQIALHADRFIPGLRRLTARVHEGGARIFAELSHAGSQTMMPGVTPPAPSGIPSAIYPGVPRELPAAEVAAIVADFGAAARRAAEAGFDGIHLHGGNGYLISQFASPLTNRRDDAWGGDAARRGRFFIAVLDAVRAAVGPDMPVTARFGLRDSIAGGMTEEEGLARAAALTARGLDGFEPSLNLMASYRDNIRPYVGLGLARAMGDLVAPRLWSAPAPQGYYRPLARALRRVAPDKAIILVGGLRDTDVMAEVLAAGEADFLSFARPFVREPDFPKQLAAGRRGALDCVSCNICLQHDGYDALRCWRRDKGDLLRHALWRMRGAG